jgi:hypothetical protein
MKKSGRPPHLTLVDPDITSPRPSRALGEHGEALWGRVTREYLIEDAAGIEMLTQICQACDRAEALAAHVSEDGEIVRTPAGIKARPAVSAANLSGIWKL